MYLYLGKHTVIPINHIIAMIDLEKSSISKFTKEFLHDATKKQHIINVSYDMPKSFVVCVENEKQTVYICSLAVTTLTRRLSLMDSTASC